MGSIGQTGKQSRDFGQGRRLRYYLTHASNSADTTALRPPRVQRQRRSQSTLDSPGDVTSPDAPSPVSTTSDSVQRAVSVDRVGASVEPSEQSASSEQETSPEEIAKQVYKLFLADTKNHQERLGTRYDR